MTVLKPVIEFLSAYKRPVVSLNMLLAQVELPRRPLLRVMDRLVRDGHLEEIEDNKVAPVYGSSGGRVPRNPTWRIIEPPVLADFVHTAKKSTLRDKMWRIIRARRRFTRLELMRLTGCKEGSATDYTNLLNHHGYLRMIGKDGHQKVFMLVKDPGPKRPVTPEVKKNVE